MNKSTAIHSLTSKKAHERLLGARFLAQFASIDDVEQLRLALQKEDVSWVRNALGVALKRATGGIQTDLKGGSDTDVELASPTNQQIEEVWSTAVHETTSLLLHEIEPLLGMTRLYARRELPNYEQSKTKMQLELLDSLLTAISDLRKASGPAQPIDIEFSALIREVRNQEVQGHKVEVQLAGPSPFSVIADRGRLWLAAANGLRNAIEATELIEESDRRPPIVINWNRTEHDFWVSIIDHGIGLKASLDRIFEIGTSSKKDHLGMGLPVARHALISMSGDVTVTPREKSGTKFEMRWPRFAASSP